MSKTQDQNYHEVRKKLMPQMRRCRNSSIRIKVELILLALKLGNVSLACKRLGLGRTCFYKWWKRLVKAKFKIQALDEQSRRPKRSPNKINRYLERRIKQYRRIGYGPDMIRELLIREGKKPISASTINHVINKRVPGHLKPKPNKLRKHRKRYELPVPGQRLQIDVKYSPMTVGGQTIYIYVAVDECTRWRFNRAYKAVNHYSTIDFLERLEKEMPFPLHVLQTDNGQEFSNKLNCMNRDWHEMDVWCDERGYEHQLIPPGVKELNGKVERSHRIDAEYFYGNAPTDNIDRFNEAMVYWIRYYNLHRPHGGLQYQTPLEKLRERIKNLRKWCYVNKKVEAIRMKFTKSVKMIEEPVGKRESAA